MTRKGWNVHRGMRKSKGESSEAHLLFIPWAFKGHIERRDGGQKEKQRNGHGGQKS